MSELGYETLVLRRQGPMRDVPPGDNEDLRWVANSGCGLGRELRLDDLGLIAAIWHQVQDHDRRCRPGGTQVG